MMLYFLKDGFSIFPEAKLKLFWAEKNQELDLNPVGNLKPGETYRVRIKTKEGISHYIKSDKKHGELIDNLRISSQKQLAEEELFNLKNDYECLIRQKNQLLTKNDKLNTLTKELENLRLKKRETYDSAYRRIYGRRIEEVRAEIREILIKMRKQDKEIGEKIKITESKIKQLENDLSSDKFMTNQEIKKRLLRLKKKLGT